MATLELLPSTDTQHVKCLSMGGEPRPRVGDKGPKLTVDGRATSSVPVVVLRADGTGQERGATLAVVSEYAKDYPLGTFLRSDGKTWLTPYVTDAGRLGLSYVCERLVPCQASAPAPTPPAAASPTATPPRRVGE